MSKTVRVRIAVAVDNMGDWVARGNILDRDEQSKVAALRQLGRYDGRSQHIVFVEADIAVPEPVTVEGTVARPEGTAAPAPSRDREGA